MRTSGRHIRRKYLGASAALCDVCSARFSRAQLVRGTDGMLRCSGPGTFNDARGRTEKELNECVSAASLEGAQSFRFSDDPGDIDKGEI